MWSGNPPGSFQEFQLLIRPSWVVMEFATIVTGLVFLVYIRFPFLLFPISFCLWFLSMDLAPLYPGFRDLGWTKAFEIRRRVSLVFGIGIMLSGYVFETVLGSEPDMGFWLYLFGTFTFWTTLNFHFPRRDFDGSLFLFVQIALILIGSHLNCTTFHVFGTLGIIEYVGALYGRYVRLSSSFLLWVLKAVAAAALFSQSLRRDGDFELVAGLVCVLAFNFNYLSFSASGELYSVFLLFSNLGFVSTAAAFSGPFYLWFFTLPHSGTAIIIVCSFLVAIFHLKLVVEYIIHLPFTLKDCLFIGYRLVMSVLISLVFIYLHLPHFASVGGLGFPLIAVILSPTIRELRNNLNLSTFQYIFFNCATFSLLLFGVGFSVYLQSNFLYLICCMIMLITILCLLDKFKILGCILSILLVLASVPLQSSFLITIGVIYIFCYLSYLAYDYFKNSLLFPLALIVLGLSVIFCGIQYQKYEEIIHSLLYSFLPQSLVVLISQNFEANFADIDAYNFFSSLHQTKFTVDSFFSAPQNWILWPGALTFALWDGPLPYVSVGCGLVIVMLIIAALVLSYRESLMKHLDDSINVSSLCMLIV